MKYLLVLCAFWLAVFPASAAPAKDSPEAVAHQFYRAYLQLNPRGLPSVEEMKTFGPLFSQELNKGIAKARAEQEKFIRDHPDNKPPWCEGNLFASSYEGVSSYSLGSSSKIRDKASIAVHLDYKEEGQIVARWIDVIVLEKTAEGWRVWDIFLNAPWDFKSGPSLRAMLPNALTSAPP